MLKKTLEGVLSTSESEELISAFDQIGDIIIVRIPDSLLSKKEYHRSDFIKRGKDCKKCLLSSLSSRRRFSY